MVITWDKNRIVHAEITADEIADFIEKYGSKTYSETCVCIIESCGLTFGTIVELLSEYRG